MPTLLVGALGVLIYEDQDGQGIEHIADRLRPVECQAGPVAVRPVAFQVYARPAYYDTSILPAPHRDQFSEVIYA